MKERFELLSMSLSDKDGKVVFSDAATEKQFKTGSTGFYCGGKMTNTKTGERYQITCSIVLIGSKGK